jgi:rubrerythrin
MATDVFDYAMQMELDGKAFYEKGAAGTDNPSLKRIFSMLAEEENRHYHVFQKMKSGEDTHPGDLAPKGRTVTLAKNVFQEMVDAGQEKLAGDTKTDIWREALEIERKSEKLYRDAAAEETDAGRRDMLNRIADEEKNHIYLIDNMISFLSDPASFIASQNFKNFMSWEGH